MDMDGRHLKFELADREAFVPPIGYFQHDAVQQLVNNPESEAAQEIDKLYEGSIEGLQYLRDMPITLPIAVADFVKSAAAFRVNHIAENIPRSVFGPQLHIHQKQAKLYLARLAAIHSQIRIS